MLGLGINLGLGIGVTGGGGNSDATNRLMFFASGAKVPSGSLVTAASGTNYVMTKLVFGSPQYAVNKLRLHFSPYACDTAGNSPQETILPVNDIPIDGVWVEVGGVATKAKFAGSDGVTMTSGTKGSWTDEIILPSDMPAETLFTVYTLYHTAVGEKQVPVHQIEKHRGERVWGDTSAAPLIALIGTTTASTAALDTNYGNSSTQPTYFGPDMMAAKGWDGRPVALVVGDSIGERQNDSISASDARRNKGWLRRWLDKADATYGRTPHFMMAIPGASSDRELNTSATLRWDALDDLITLNGGKWPFTFVLNQHGRNDYNATYSTMKTNWKGLPTRIVARYPGANIIAMGQVVHPSSSDGFSTLTNQTYQTGGVWPNGNRYLLEDDKAALMDGTLIAYINVTDPTGLDAIQGKWPIPYFNTTLAAGVSGTYSSIQLTASPILGDFLHFDTTGAPVLAVVTDITGSGPYTCTLDRSLTTTYSAGQTVYSPNANDGSGTPRTGTHPRPRMIQFLADNVPQSGKATFTHTTPQYGSNLVTNGDFASALTTGWTAGADCAIVSGACVITYASVAGATLDQAVTTEVGATYYLEYTCNADTTTTGILTRVGTTQGGTDLFNTPQMGAGFKRITFTATTTTSWLRLRISNNAATIDNVRIRKVNW